MKGDEHFANIKVFRANVLMLFASFFLCFARPMFMIFGATLIVGFLFALFEK